jgi:hypothetical protein
MPTRGAKPAIRVTPVADASASAHAACIGDSCQS